ncbi:MAG: SHOCT domain-containing protein [Candidatus Tectomicrobia bacterium]
MVAANVPATKTIIVSALAISLSSTPHSDISRGPSPPCHPRRSTRSESRPRTDNRRCPPRSPWSSERTETALEILKKRYAKGEISQEDFERIKANLTT